MKKILLFVIAALLTVSAHAQLSDGFHTFTIGEYVMYPVSFQKNNAMGGGVYEYRAEDEEEASNLARFINKNKKALQDKYGITIMYAKDYGREFRVMVYDTDTYNKYQETKEQKRIAEENRKNREKAARMRSLETL